jgi:hypothetical protein
MGCIAWEGAAERVRAKPGYHDWVAGVARLLAFNVMAVAVESVYQGGNFAEDLEVVVVVRHLGELVNELRVKSNQGQNYDIQ